MLEKTDGAGAAPNKLEVVAEPTLLEGSPNVNVLVTAGKEKEVFVSPEDVPRWAVLAVLSPKENVFVVMVLPPLLLAGAEEADDGVDSAPLDGVPNVKLDGGLGNEIDAVFKLEFDAGPSNEKVVEGAESLGVVFSTSGTTAFLMFCS